MSEKKIGIAVDNFKIDTFKKALEKADFKKYEVLPFTDGTSLIRVFTDDSHLLKLQRLCAETNKQSKNG